MWRIIFIFMRHGPYFGGRKREPSVGKRRLSITETDSKTSKEKIPFFCYFIVLSQKYSLFSLQLHFIYILLK